jgi:hypothetical protein
MESIRDFLLYASTSANMHNFLGRSDPKELYRLYKSIVSLSAAAHKDLMEFKVDGLRLEDPLDILGTKEHWPIMITFHAGSYNMLIAALLARGHHLYTLSDTRSTQFDDYLLLGKHYSKRYESQCEVTMLNVQETNAIFRIIHVIRAGVPMIAFIDGNKGVDGLTKENENMADIKFLNGVVRVRQGLPYLAFITDVPLVLALSYKKDGVDYLKFYDPLKKQPGESRDSFCKRSLETIFQCFERHVLEYEDQWASWPYVHYWSDLTKFHSAMEPVHVDETFDFDSLSFNADRFLPIKFKDNFLLFDKATYTATRIDKKDSALFSSKTTDVDRGVLLRDLSKVQRDKVKDFVCKGFLVIK